MYSASSNHRFHPAFVQGYGAAGPASVQSTAGGEAGAGSTSTGTETNSAGTTAREAVDAIVKLAEAQATQTEAGSHAVNLGFKFGQERLSVRVEMSEGEVRTQFTTDSADLRAAINGEWQTFTAGSPERASHFADPVFTATGGTATDTGAGGGASRQPFPATWAGQDAADPGKDATDASLATPETASPAPFLSTSRHLHTFA